ETSPERPEIGVPVFGHPAGDERARPLLPRRDLDVGISLVVPQADVVTRAMLLDERVFEQQRFELGVGDDRFQVLPGPEQRLRLGGLRPSGEVRGHALLERAGLAGVQDLSATVLEKVDAGRVGNVLGRTAGLGHFGSVARSSRDREKPIAISWRRMIATDERVSLLLRARRAQRRRLSQLRQRNRAMADRFLHAPTAADPQENRGVGGRRLRSTPRPRGVREGLSLDLISGRATRPTEGTREPARVSGPEAGGLPAGSSAGAPSRIPPGAPDGPPLPSDTGRG